MLVPPVEGALAPNPAPTRDTQGPRRRIEREKTWKDEVRERVRHRKQEKARDRTGSELPLFKDPAPESRTEEPQPDPVVVEPARHPVADPAPPLPAVTLGELPEDLPRTDPYALTEELTARSLDEGGEDDDDLPLNVALPEAKSAPPPDVEPRRSVPEDVREEIREKWFLDEPEPREESPVERPAFPGERARAAGVDLLFLAALWAVVVYFAYFAGRDFHAGTAQFLRTWPWLVGYLSFLGLTYAAYFTGTTGQTLGKILGGLRVVDTAGRPPGYLRAFARAALGGLGVLLLGLGVAPMLVDPARRAFHDKLLGTRVVRK
jgi:uncharacterized RDD family membrane protein YckC